MPAASMLSYMGILDGGNSKHNKEEKNKKDKSSGASADKCATNVTNLQARVRALLKEDPGNKNCAECRNAKPKWMSLLTTPNPQTIFGVFVCNSCFNYHTGLGDDHCRLKSLKEPATWTVQDVENLEKSGNKAVNAIYLSALEGNHNDKHLGALASSDFIEGKYKKFLYFSEEAYEKHLKKRANKADKKRGKDDDCDEPEFSTEADGSSRSMNNSGVSLGSVSNLHNHLKSPLEMDDDASVRTEGSQRLSRKERIALKQLQQSMDGPSNHSNSSRQSFRRTGSYGGSMRNLMHGSLSRVMTDGNANGKTLGSILGGNTGDDDMDASAASSFSTQSRLRRSISTDGGGLMGMRRAISGSVRGRRTSIAREDAQSTDIAERRERSRSRRASKRIDAQSSEILEKRERSRSMRASRRESLRTALNEDNKHKQPKNSLSALALGTNSGHGDSVDDDEKTKDSMNDLFDVKPPQLKAAMSASAVLNASVSTTNTSTTNMFNASVSTTNTSTTNKSAPVATTKSLLSPGFPAKAASSNADKGQAKTEKSRRGTRRSVAMGEALGENEGTGSAERPSSRKGLRKSKSMGLGCGFDPEQRSGRSKSKEPGTGHRRQRKSVSPKPPPSSRRSIVGVDPSSTSEGCRMTPLRTKSGDQDPTGTFGVMKRAGKSMRRSASMGGNGAPPPPSLKRVSSASRRGLRNSMLAGGERIPIVSEEKGNERRTPARQQSKGKGRSSSVSRRLSKRTSVIGENSNGERGKDKVRSKSATRRAGRRSSSMRNIVGQAGSNEAGAKGSSTADRKSRRLGRRTSTDVTNTGGDGKAKEEGGKGTSEPDRKSRRSGRTSVIADTKDTEQGKEKADGAKGASDADKKSRRGGRRKSSSALISGSASKEKDGKAKNDGGRRKSSSALKLGSAAKEPEEGKDKTEEAKGASEPSRKSRRAARTSTNTSTVPPPNATEENKNKTDGSEGVDKSDKKPSPEFPQTTSLEIISDHACSQITLSGAPATNPPASSDKNESPAVANNTDGVSTDGPPPKRKSSRLNLRKSMSLIAEGNIASIKPPSKKKLARSMSVGYSVGNSGAESDDGEPEGPQAELSSLKSKTDKNLLAHATAKPNMRSNILKALSARNLVGTIKDMPKATMHRIKSDKALASIKRPSEENHKRRLMGHLAATEGAMPKQKARTAAEKASSEDRKKKLQNLRDSYRESFRGLTAALSDPNLVANHVASRSSAKRSLDPAPPTNTAKSMLGGDDDEVSISSADEFGPDVNDNSEVSGSESNNQEGAAEIRKGKGIFEPFHSSARSGPSEESLDVYAALDATPPSSEESITANLRDVAPKQAKRTSSTSTTRQGRFLQTQRRESAQPLGDSKDETQIELASEPPKSGADLPLADEEVSQTLREDAAKPDPLAELLEQNSVSKPWFEENQSQESPFPPEATGYSDDEDDEQSLNSWKGFNDNSGPFEASQMSAARLVPVSEKYKGNTAKRGSIGNSSKSELFNFSSGFPDLPSREDLGYGSMEESAPDLDYEDENQSIQQSQRSTLTKEASARHLLASSRDADDEEEEPKDAFLANFSLKSDGGYFDEDESAARRPDARDHRRRSEGLFDLAEDSEGDPLAVSRPVAV